MMISHKTVKQALRLETTRVCESLFDYDDLMDGNIENQWFE